MISFGNDVAPRFDPFGIVKGHEKEPAVPEPDDFCGDGF
jgi:hypothetical protein